ncbi:MAG: hypothetical protein PHU97_06290 [Bacteroidales bacterium]|nr:hypothetical protein [Bacteroidales bacterium]
MKQTFLLLLVIAFFTQGNVYAGKKKDHDEKKEDKLSLSFLKFRNIGPAYCSGRIGDFAVNPDNPSEYYVAVSSGNVWKTINNGTTWNPVFDDQGSYSIGCVTMSPQNHNVVWVGTGENNHQRALGYGDGVYKSLDGGQSWKNMGLKESRQIGDIIIDPRNEDVVYVAAEGSAWGPGGERGLYKTTDGGKTWTLSLEISENTGVNNVAFDPSNPNVIYATSEQRRRHVNTKIGGGPESAFYKSTDAGATWRKITKGLPSSDIGGMGLAVSPVNTDILYIIAEAQGESGGFFRSTDRGESWEKMSDHHSSGQYYNEIYCDPVDENKVFSVETYTHYTEDGGKTWKRLGLNNRHVDDHALWIDPENTIHLLIGGDGGIYETWDMGATWAFKENLPVTQFYRVNVDDAYPFYNVYGGTQDNNSLFGPSATTSYTGITNDDYTVMLGGDGFWTAVDPSEPNIVYCESQYGNICRYDRKNGVKQYIRPVPLKNEMSYKWNWNTPVIISPHSATRLYMAANKVFRTNDRGDSWEVISDDLTAQVDRNTWPTMGKFWPSNAVAKDVSTSLFGTIVSLAESPVTEGLLFAGSDDGVLSIQENNQWKKYSEFPGVPDYSYISDICPDNFDDNTLYIAFDNLKRDDFKPYILKSTDKGASWVSISANLPENGTVHTIVQDYMNAEILFVGTEFGAFVTLDGGASWNQLKSGIPTIAVRDLVIQKSHNDLVAATFGRGFYILDDYSPLREYKTIVEKESPAFFQVPEALMFNRKSGKGSLGETYFRAKNPDFGAIFTYYLKDVPATKKSTRMEEEKKLFKDSKPIPQPTNEQLREEEKQIQPHLIFTIRDKDGQVVRILKEKPSKGVSRISWDMEYQNPGYPVRLAKNAYNPTHNGRGGVNVLPGEYTVDMAMYEDGEIQVLAGPVAFKTNKWYNGTLHDENEKATIAFIREYSDLTRIIRGTYSFGDDLASRVEHIRQALNNTPGADPAMLLRAHNLAFAIDDVLFAFHGESAKASHEEIPPHPLCIDERMDAVSSAIWGATTGVNKVMTDNYAILVEEFPPLLNKLEKIYEKDIPELENYLESINAPYTPGRVPVWTK